MEDDLRYFANLVKAMRSKRASDLVSLSVAASTKGSFGLFYLEHGNWGLKQKSEVF